MRYTQEQSELSRLVCITVSIHFQANSKLCVPLSYSLQAYRSPDLPALGPRPACMPRRLSAVSFQLPSHPQRDDTDRVTHCYTDSLPRRFYQPPSHRLHQRALAIGCVAVTGELQRVAQLCGEARRRAGGWQLAQRGRSLTRLLAGFPR
jgi:hypothetical protein